MRRSRLILTLSIYLVAISLAGPLAFQIGIAHGRGLKTDVWPGPFVVAAAPGDVTSDFFNCDGAIRLPALRIFDRVQDCRPEGEGTGRGRAGEKIRRRFQGSSGGPLARAFMRSIARGPLEGAAPIIPEGAFIVSSGSSAKPLGGAAPSSSGFLMAGGGFGGAGIPSGSDIPANLLTALDVEAETPPPTVDPDPETPTPPPPEVPVPPAFFLMLTGAAGLKLLAKSRRAA